MEQIDIFSGDEVISRVFVEDGVEGLADCLRPYSRVFAVMDRQVAVHCPAAVQMADVLNAADVPGMLVEAAERTKTMDTVLEICSWLLEQGADRDALVLAIGGGITSDMTGFAASIYKRGVRFAYAPTTLLSQVDAAIGGKTGVNFEKYKNMLGVIRQPEFTYLCPQVLSSLSPRDFLSGAAEMMKTFVIEDGGWYARAADWLGGYRKSLELQGIDGCHEYVDASSGELTALIAAAARVKAGVVSRDQFEKGERRKLNLGHTFAHAVETLAQRDGTGIGGVTHGEAVAMGMVMVARLAERLSAGSLGDERFPDDDSVAGLVRPGLAARIEADLRACGLPVDCPYGMAEMAEAMGKDKKAEGGKVHFVLPFDIGDVRMMNLSVEDVVKVLS